MRFTPSIIYSFVAFVFVQVDAIPIKRIRDLEERTGIVPSPSGDFVRLEGLSAPFITLLPAPVHASATYQSPTPSTTETAWKTSAALPLSNAMAISATASIPSSSPRVLPSILAGPNFTGGISSSNPLIASITRPSTNIPTKTITPEISAGTPIAVPVTHDGSRKYVVAHHIVGNTFPYTIEDWAEDITLAHAAGIDGFALNCGIDEWEPARVADAYEAARRSGLEFKLFISLDMSSLPCGSSDDARRLRDFVQPYLNHPNQLQYNSRAFVSTFAGEACKFGQTDVVEGWKTQFVKHSDLQGRIYFVPAFFVDPATFGDFLEVMDGDFNWNSGWPIQVTSSFVEDVIASLPAAAKSPIANSNLRIANTATGPLGSLVDTLSVGISGIESALSKFIGSTESDDEHLKGLEVISGVIRARDGSQSSPLYMGAVSPWFFTHYGEDSYNKNRIFLSDQHLYAKRWESIVSNRDQFDIIQVLTWNDYGESHYIGPIKGAQPNSEAWVNGFNHTSWLDLTQYYATAYKTGAFPTIEKDKIFMWSRPHPCQAVTDDPIGQPDNFELSQDVVWTVVMTTAPSIVTLSTSADNSKQFSVPAGVSKLSIPITAGGMMRGLIQRDGKTIVELAPPEFVFQGIPTSYNFNAFVASATATE